MDLDYYSGSNKKNKNVCNWKEKFEGDCPALQCEKENWKFCVEFAWGIAFYSLFSNEPTFWGQQQKKVGVAFDYNGHGFM